MHTPIKFYVTLPVDLFRGGTATEHKFDYIRTMPPRKAEETFDLKLDSVTNKIDHTSGGLSLFNTPNYNFGSHWWVIPAGTKLPLGYTLSKDLTDGKFRGHYTIRATSDIKLNIWKQQLSEWADEYAVNLNEYKQENNNV